MAGHYITYPEYKNSGVEWIGDIPKHWKISKLKHIFSIINGSTPRSGISAYWDGDIIWATPADLSKLSDFKISTSERKITHKGLSSCGTSIVSSGSLVLSSRAPIGSLAISAVPLCTNQGCKSLTPRFKNNIKFFYYYMSVVKEQLNLLGRGTTFLELSTDDLGFFAIPLPKLAEQELIAKFLDFEIDKIDTLIEKQQQLIKLLKEKRQAVISHAVTKGLNPQTPMKDSGVEWLGEVPEHWGMIKLKHITHQIIDAEHKTAPYYDDGEYLVCRTTNVKDGKLRLEGGKYTNNSTYEEWTKRGLPEVGDILFTREAPAGEACVYTGEVPLCLGQRMVLFKLDQTRVSPDFVLHSIYSGLADDFVKQLSQGSTVAHFNMADIKNIPLFEPPIDEQVKIVEYLSMVLAKYDSLTSSVFRAIELMQERRTALISAAVTGKIDVRHWEQPND